VTSETEKTNGEAPANGSSKEVVRLFEKTQRSIWNAVEEREGKIGIEQAWNRPEGGGGVSIVIENGSVFEKGGVNFSHVSGRSLPASATENRPRLADFPFEATGVSVVLHPVNPHAPTAHMNVRAFFVRTDTGPVWWFGGGFDLTPCYGYDEDAIEWHQAAKNVCDDLDTRLYVGFKRACDRYFYLPHRDEGRGIGGIFFDDLNKYGFSETLAFTLSVAEAFRTTYFRIVDRRHTTPYGNREIEHQRVRRGRYVEFNLLYDRGTRFGLASGGRTESILVSMPLHADWRTQHTTSPGTPEEELLTRYLRPRNWLDEDQPLEPIQP